MPRNRTRWRGVFPAIFLLSLGAAGWSASTANAASITGLGIENFFSNGQKSELGTGLSGMAETVLSEIINAPLYKDCPVKQVEVRRQAEIERELELGKVPGVVDPKSRLTDRTIPLGHRITGSVIESAEGGSFSLSLEDAKSGEIIGTVTGGGKNIAELEAALRDSLRKLVDRLCTRAYTLKASVGPHFQIESQICGLDKPFTVRPKGKFSGLTLVFTPQSDTNGTFTQSGKAYGAEWKGGGPYTITWNGDSGRFVAQDSYTTRSVAGGSQNSDQMTGTVTRLAKSCSR